MRRLMIFTALLLTLTRVFGQEDMPVVWETKLSHHILHAGTSLEGGT